MPRRNHIPAYRLHKQSRQAIVILRNGVGGRRDFTLGVFGSPESKAEYARILSEWQANGCQPPQAVPPAGSDVSINQLILDYWAIRRG